MKDSVHVRFEVPKDIHFAIVRMVTAEREKGNRAATISEAYIEAARQSIAK